MRNVKYTIEHSVDSTINVGDKVRVIDGSAFTVQRFNGEFLIGEAYPNLFHDNSNIMDLHFTVTKTNVTDRGCGGVLDMIYIQDIEIEYNGIKCNTYSGFVMKLKKGE